MRAAIYARFSTDLQNERSVDDQIALCRAYAGREGLTVVDTFSDSARSGASIFGREGLIQLLAQATKQPRSFDVLLVEHSDRLSRSMKDLAGIHENLTFAGITIRAVHSGEMNTAMIGLFGLVGQMQREDGARKTHRGLAGVVRAGRSAGGRAYGYRPVAGQPGELEIVPAEADVVRRIMSLYAGGMAPRSIAHELNREGVSPPRGGRWNASTINGNGQRGSGILLNELYAGRIVWNKVRMIKDPATGRRVSRPNAPDEWQSVERPDLAIIDRDLFDAVAARKGVRSIEHGERKPAPRHLLSGLLRCGSCGAGMSRCGRDKSGRTRIRCSAATESGVCPEPKTFYLDVVEQAVLAGLKAELRAPEVLAEYVRAYHAERQRLAGDVAKTRAKIARQIAEQERVIRRTMDMLLREVGIEADLSAQQKAAGAARDALRAELGTIAEPPKTIALHPQVLARYEQQVARLGSALSEGINRGDGDGATALRDLVDSVTVYRDKSRSDGISIEIAGRLNALLGEEAYPNAVCFGMVAGEGLEPPTRGL
ncbi:recombinase family protein [Bosea sp. PAMC 26642]|uniref:recombinase family protein n=1 Tax=Bosea sp. (strain PAMC 26642) TaxID=1792307 RepID=UPI0009E82E05|nr:recombinase family protein [Bosea sp. PAMC 26642]